jgi:hypothetical protein
MRAYVLTTGVIFGLIVAAHVWRVAAESPLLARDPSFVIVTLICAALCAWAVRLGPEAPRLLNSRPGG